MACPCQLRLFANQSVIGARRTCHHHRVKYLLVLAHQGNASDFHAAVVEELGVLQSQAVFFGEGRTYRDAQNLGLNRARSPYGTEIVAITGRELRGYSGRWGRFDGGCLSTVAGDGLLRNNGFAKDIDGIGHQTAKQEADDYPANLLDRVFHLFFCKSPIMSKI